MRIVGEPDRTDDDRRMHLTVCRLGAPAAEVDEITRLEPALPIPCEVGDLLIAEMDAAGQVRVRPPHIR